MAYQLFRVFWGSGFRIDGSCESCGIAFLQKGEYAFGSLSGQLLRGQQRQHRGEDDKYAPGFWFYSLVPFRNGVYHAEALLSIGVLSLQSVHS